MKSLAIGILLTAALSTWSAPINITVNDGNGYSGTGVGGEDSETEPGMINDQSWDLEAFVQDGTTLSLIGGYDFKNGNSGYLSGDIFFDVTGDAVYGAISGASDGYQTIQSTSGYDYVMDLNWATNTYDLYSLNSTSYTNTTYYAANKGSNPWTYASGGTLLQSGIAINYATGLALPYSGATHNRVNVDIGFLGAGTSFTTHYTMACGNDNIIGKGSLPSVPEPTSMVFMGLGLLGLAVRNRKRFQK